MKNGVLYFLILMLPLNMVAQKTISSLDIGSIGDTVLMANDTNYIGKIDFGKSGAEVKWYYDFLLNDRLDTLQFLDPATTPEGALGGSNLVLKGGLLDTYWDKQTTYLGVTAYGFDFDFSLIDSTDSVRTAYIEYDQPIRHAKFDMEYLDYNISSTEGSYIQSYQDTFMGFYIDKFKLVDNVTVEDSVNGYGTLYLPDDTLDCIRQDLQITHSFDVEIYYGGFWVPLSFIGLSFPIPDIEENYVRYWARRQNYPILEFMIDSLGEGTSTRYMYNTVEYLDAIAEKTKTASFNIYPNPTSGTFFIQSIASRGVKPEDIDLTLFDATGRKVPLNIHFLNKNLLEIDIVEKNKGIYFLRTPRGSQQIIIE